MKGGYYGASGAIPGAPGAMKWSAGSEMGPFVSGRAGNSTVYGSGRRRKTSRRTKKMKRTRKMRGGNKYGGVSASYQGSGTAGLANYSAVSTRGAPGTAAGGQFNNFGAGVGSGHANFVKAV